MVRALVVPHPPAEDGVADDGGSAGEPQLSHSIRLVCPHSLNADVEAGGDLLVAVAERELLFVGPRPGK